MGRKRPIPLNFWSVIICVLSVVGWCYGGTVKKVMSVGDNATFDCYPPRNSASHVLWSSRRSPNPTEHIAFVNLDDGASHLYPNFQNDRYSSNFVRAWSSQESKFTLSIRNLTVENSSNYVCEMVFFDGQNPVKLMQHQIIVIGCECSLDDAGPDQSLSCAVDGYQSTSSELLATKVTMSETVTERNGVLQINTLSIPLQTGEISRITSIEFNPLSHESFQSFVSCSLPKFTTSNPDVPTIPSISTGLMSFPPHSTIPDVHDDSRRSSVRTIVTTTPDVSTGLMSSSPHPNIPKANGTVFPCTFLPTNNASMCKCSTLIIVSSVLGTISLVLIVELFVLFLYRRTQRCRAPRHAKGNPDEGETGTAAVEVNEVYYSSVKQPDTDTICHEYATFIEKTKAESE